MTYQILIKGIFRMIFVLLVFITQLMYKNLKNNHRCDKKQPSSHFHENMPVALNL